MASIPFTLAALATSAVPGLMVLGTRGHEEDESFLSAIVSNGTDEFIVRVPRTQAAEVQQSAELLSLAALTEGSRAALPFTIPKTVGMTRAGDTRAVVTTFIDGERFAVEDLELDALLLQPLATVLAKIHDLPHSVAQQGGLPLRSARDLRLQATRLIDRAETTRLVPRTILDRWKQVVETSELWDFAPTVVHGSLDADHLRVLDDEITGIVGWSELSVGDPATDIAWLLDAGPEVMDAVLARYASLRAHSVLVQLRTRAALYHELEVARWLLHGTESHDDRIIDDAVRMLDRLVDTVGAFGTSLATTATTPLTEHEVESLLNETPEVNDLLSDTAAYEALDEDRMFGVDTDFIEPLHEPETRADFDTDREDSPDEQLTEPISDTELSWSTGQDESGDDVERDEVSVDDDPSDRNGQSVSSTSSSSPPPRAKSVQAP